jgi:hypothetical protein
MGLILVVAGLEEAKEPSKEMSSSRIPDPFDMRIYGSLAHCQP